MLLWDDYVSAAQKCPTFEGCLTIPSEFIFLNDFSARISRLWVKIFCQDVSVYFSRFRYMRRLCIDSNSINLLLKAGTKRDRREVYRFSRWRLFFKMTAVFKTLKRRMNQQPDIYNIPKRRLGWGWECYKTAAILNTYLLSTSPLAIAITE